MPAAFALSSTGRISDTPAGATASAEMPLVIWSSRIDIDLALGRQYHQVYARGGARGLFGAGLHALPPLAVERFGDECDLDGLVFCGAATRCCDGDQE